MPAGLRARDERGGPGAAPRPPLLPFLMAASTPFGRLKTLDDILRRMADHRHKKRSLLRRLKLADDLLPG